MSNPSWSVVVFFILLATLVGAATAQPPAVGPAHPPPQRAVDPRLAATDHELLIQLLDRMAALQAEVAQLQGHLDERANGLGQQIRIMSERVLRHCHQQAPQFGDVCGPA